MQYTSNYNLKKPEGTDVVNIQDLNDNADILDQKLKEVDGKATNAPADSVNDAAIGTRTPDQSQVPASPGTGKLTDVLSWLANRIKAIMGSTNWWDTPPVTLQTTKNHIDAAAPHSGHETPAGAQAKADAALAAAKQYTDQEVGEVAQALTTHLAEHLRIEIGVAPPENPNSKTFWYEDLGESIDFVLGGGLLIGNASTDGSNDVWFDENV